MLGAFALNELWDLLDAENHFTKPVLELAGGAVTPLPLNRVPAFDPDSELSGGPSSSSSWLANTWWRRRGPRPRPDLARAGLGHGKNGYRIHIPRRLWTDGTESVSARLHPSGVVLGGSPRPLDSTTRYSYAVDKADGREVIGWIRDAAYPRTRFDLMLIHDGQPVAVGGSERPYERGATGVSSSSSRKSSAVFDPYSRQPAYKACAVRVVRVRDREQGLSI